MEIGILGAYAKLRDSYNNDKKRYQPNGKQYEPVILTEYNKDIKEENREDIKERLDEMYELLINKVGQIAGYYGLDNIPADWVKKLAKKELIFD